MFTLTWFTNGYTGAQDFNTFDEASDAAYAIIYTNKYCYVAIYSKKTYIFKYEKLMIPKILN